MAFGELTGATQSELIKMQNEYQSSPMFENHDIPFDVAYCLTEIGKQPDDYDGPQRFCKNRACKLDEYDIRTYKLEAYAPSCNFHGGTNDAGNHTENLDNPKTAGVTHGVYAKDEHLIMDFNDEEQKLYDSIMNDWPEIYNWPAESEDPARYRILRRVAVNEVRSERGESYLDKRGEVITREIPTENGVQTEDVENPVAREYRLLMSEVTDQMRELGLTPKERQKMDTLESQADKDDALTDIASDALGGDEEYDPDQFDE